MDDHQHPLLGQSDDPQYVVVVQRIPSGDVTAVLGPRSTYYEAKALSEVLRLGQYLRASVQVIRVPDVADLHGPEALEQWHEIERQLEERHAR